MSIEWEFKLNFDELKAKVADAIPKAIASGLEVIRADSTARVPVGGGDAGKLMNSANVQVVDGVGSIQYPGPYARYQEFGIYFRKPAKYGALLSHTHGTSFFLTIAMIASKDAALEAVAQTLKEAMK